MPVLWWLHGNIQAFCLTPIHTRVYTHTLTHTSLRANMVKRREKKKKKPSSPFPLPPISALYSASVPNPQHIDLSSLSSDFILRTKQLGRGGASPAGPDLSCKKTGGEEKRKEDDTSSEESRRRGRGGQENINKGVLIWWSPVAQRQQRRKGREKKLLTIQKPLSGSLGNWSMEHQASFQGRMLKNR